MLSGLYLGGLVLRGDLNVEGPSLWRHTWDSTRQRRGIRAHLKAIPNTSGRGRSCKDVGKTQCLD